MEIKDYQLISQRRFNLLQKTLFGASLAIVVMVVIYFGLDIVYTNRVLPGVVFMDISLGGKTYDEVLSLLEERVDQAKLSSLQLEFDGSLWVIDPNEFDFQIKADTLAERALQIGRQGSLSRQIPERWYALTATSQALINSSDLVHSFDQDKLKQYLQTIAQQIDQPQLDAKLAVLGDRATEFVIPQDGQQVDIEQTIVLIAQNVLSPQPSIGLPVVISPADSDISQTNTLGINTLIARGVSDFSGSPSNRRHNIKIGADQFDGVLIAPDATFSMLRTLGRVDASTGYLPELVIKGDETIPEFGGGLCQVSTTAFRAILNGGFPVVARRNHSYRVVYYEPAGTDATIYQPYPDLKFTNDTPGYILIDTYMDGDKLYFDFYGTDIGRSVEFDGPHVYNVTDYPEPIYIDTSALPPGETQQIDSAHRGADAVLYRKIYQDGKLQNTDTFRSHYIPWPAKYLRGVEEAPELETDLENVLPEDAASEEALVDLIGIE